MTRIHIVLVSAVLAALIAAPITAQKATPAAVQLEAANQKAALEGDLPGAIKLYEQIVSTYGKTDRTTAATALLKMASCYEQLGQPEARVTYERLAKDYPDSAPAKAALAKLGALGQGRTALTTTQVWTGTGVDSMGAVSQDGQYLSFTDWDSNDLAVRDLKSGRTRRVTSNQNGRFDQWAEYSVPSPDGRRIAYAWFNKDTYHLRVIGTDGSEPKDLCCDEPVAYIHPFGWSKDSKEVLVAVTKGPREAETAQLLIVPAAGGPARTVRTVSAGMNRAAWSPDGQFIVYDAPPAPGKDEHDLFVMRTDGSNVMPIVTHAANDVMLDWFPDGKRILFLSDRLGTNGFWTQTMNEGKPAGEPALAKSDVGNIEGEGFTRDGSYYYSASSRTDEVLVARLDAGGTLSGRAEPLAGRFAGGKQQASWSPDGLSIAYVQTALTPGSKPALSIQAVNSGEVRTIPVSLGTFANPAWTPDGKAIVVQGDQPQGGQGLFKISLDTGALSPLSGAVVGPTEPNRGAVQLKRYPAVSRDAREVLYTLGGGMGGIMAQDLASGATRTVLASPSRSFALSPDGRLVAATPQAQETKDLMPPVRIVPVTGGEPRALATELAPANLDSGIAWSADGKYVFFSRADQQGTALWRVPVDGGPAARTGIVVRGRILRVSAHADGRLAISTAHGATEIWVMRNLLPAGGK